LGFTFLIAETSADGAVLKSGCLGNFSTNNLKYIKKVLSINFFAYTLSNKD
jgi:hypothetical protein